MIPALLLVFAAICDAAPLRSRETPIPTVEPIALINPPTKIVNYTCADDVAGWATSTLENRLAWDLLDSDGWRIGEIEAIGVSNDPGTGVRGLDISLSVDWPLVVHRAKISVDTDPEEIGSFNTQVDDETGSPFVEYWVPLSSINGVCCNNDIYIAANVVVLDTISGLKAPAMTSVTPYRTECAPGFNWKVPTCSVVMLCYNQ
eukprot:CAMPEP_0184745672 /NCGR_PEP_ID=MMETSP0315-20130426/8350_1 /TAXON_ID=101924 /ORGANISM="Rhodosorus marinus, Strain UTEX LB 2760" /LENGTH=202 /DNA_ID=CAMNT_0027217961 /DNA_START=613 /DNA_END=1221 /DNA_ORIENTATION=+